MATFANLLPAPGDLDRWTPITVDITPGAGDLPVVLAEFGAVPYDILTVYDGTSFSPRFFDHSSVTEAAGVYSFSILPVGGWMDTQTELTFGGLAALPALTFLVPAPPSTPAPELSSAGKLLGRDILFRRGDLQVGPAGDYLTTEGGDNLRLGIERRILTAQREYQLNPGYGAGAGKTIKAPASAAELDQLRAAILDQLLADRRIVEVRSLRLSRRNDLPGALRIHVSVHQLEEAEPTSFTFDLPEITG